MSAEAENQNTNPVDEGGKKPGGLLPDVHTNRQTLNAAEFSDSQPRLVTSEKSLPILDLGDQQLVSTEPISIPRGRKGRTTPCTSPSPGMNNSGGFLNDPGSPCGGFHLPIPSPIITKRTRTASV